MKTRLKLYIGSMLMAFVSISASVSDFEVDGLKYDVISFDEMTCEVVGYTGQPVDLVIPAHVTYNDRIFTVTTIHGDEMTIHSAFYNCESLKSVQIESGITNIGVCAFVSCNSLTSVIINNGVKNIDDCAFAYCNALSYITIPNSVSKIGDLAFVFCI